VRVHRRPEGAERREDADRVVSRGTHQDVEVARRSGDAVEGHGVRSDDEELGARLGQGAQHVDEVRGEPGQALHRADRMTRPGAELRS